MHRVFDFDDTLNEFTDGFVRFMQEDVLHLPIERVEYPAKYHLMHPFEGCGISTYDALKMFEASGRMNELIIPTQSRVMGLYCAAGARSILTARGWMEKPVESVREYCDYWNLPQPDDIEVIGLDTCKSDVLRDRWDHVDEYYDDHPGHLFNTFQKLGNRIRVVAAHRPWNSHLTLHDRM